MKSKSFLPVTFDRKKISFAKMHRLICMWPSWLNTWPHVTLTWGQILKLTFLGQHVSTYFDAYWREEHDAAKIISLAFLVIRENQFFKALFLPFLTSIAQPFDVRSVPMTFIYSTYSGIHIGHCGYSHRGDIEDDTDYNEGRRKRKEVVAKIGVKYWGAYVQRA